MMFTDLNYYFINKVLFLLVSSTLRSNVKKTVNETYKLCFKGFI